MTVDYNAIYGKLRQRILARNFAIGRYFRNNYMANSFSYGVVGLDFPSSRNRVLKLIELKCLRGGGDCQLYVTVEGMRRPTLRGHMDESSNQEWVLNVDYKMAHSLTATFELQREKPLASNEVIGSVTLSANQLTAPDVSAIFDDGACRFELHYQVLELVPAEVGLLEGGGSLGDPQFAQDVPNDDWHVAWHARENPLVASGVLLTCLAIEYYLGSQESLKIIRSALASIGSLYKFSGNHFDGYIIRWDAVTSDFWQENFIGGTAQPKRCLNFLTDANGKYLYCTPFDSPDYVTPDNDDVVRWPYLVRYRHWEPSLDEINGLMLGYDAVYRFVDVQDIRDTVRAQANQLGDYLAEHAYLFVRPAGGFAERGSAGPNPAMEFPFSEAFRRITGNAYPIRNNWEGAVTKAGVWNQIQTSVNSLEIGFLMAAPAVIMTGGGIVSIVAPFLTPVLGLIGLGLADIGTKISPFNLARAAAIYLNREHFDVKQTQQKDSGERDSFALAYLLLQLSPQERTDLYLAGAKKGIGSEWARTFPRYWGINAVQLPNRSDNSNPKLTAWYMDWNEAHYQTWLSKKDAADNTGVILDCALAVLNGGGPLYQTRLVNMFNDANQYTAPDESGLIIDQDLNYLCAIATTWLYVKLQQEQGVTAVFPGLPQLPDPTTWPAPSTPIMPETYVIPGDVVNQPLSAYQDKKGRSIDFGLLSNGTGAATILIALPQDYCPRPLDALQPNCSPDQLAIDANHQALVFAGDPPVQKPPEPVIHPPQPLEYHVFNPVVISGEFNSTNLQVSIAPDTTRFAYNQPALIPLTFYPERSGQFSGSLTLSTDNPYLSPLTFTLSAQVEGPQVHATPLDFGEVILGGSQVQTVWVTNDGQDDIYGFLQDEPFDQTPVNQFTLQCVLPHYCTIQPGQSFGIPTSYTASAAGPARARLEFEYFNTGSVRYKLEVALQAAGIGPELELSANALDFHLDNPVKTEQHQIINISGKTLCPVTISQIYLEALDDPAFYIQQEPELNYYPVPVTLQQNAAIGVDILFFPTRPGETHHAKLYVISNDLLLPKREILISGGAAGGLITIIWPDRLDFGVVLLSVLQKLDRQIEIDPPPLEPLPPSRLIPAPRKPVHPPKKPQPPHIPVTIKSYGTSDETLSQIFFDPPEAAFTLSGLPAAFPITLAPGTHLDFDVEFTPLEIGIYQTQLKIISSGAYQQTYHNAVTGVCKP